LLLTLDKRLTSKAFNKPIVEIYDNGDFDEDEKMEVDESNSKNS